MTANYHTHSYHCRHADEQPWEYVENAIQNGLQVLGFSDHVPYPFQKGYASSFRMSLPETQIYVGEIEEVKKEYAGKIKIYTGYEAEYYPDYFESMLEHIGQYGYDYLILGQHFINNEYDGVYSGRPCNEETLKKYVDQLIAGMKTGVFSYVAHPDLIHYRENTAIFRKEMLRLCEASIQYDIPLEFNLLGFREKRIYPYSEFWKLVGEIGCKTIIGWDAHSPKYAGDCEIYQEALKELEKYNIPPIEKLEFKKKKNI